MTDYTNFNRDFRGLPFIKDISKEERKKIGGHGRVYWTVEASGRWIDDMNKGKEYARAALAFMRRYPHHSYLLASAVKDMFMRGNYGGIEYGFLSSIGKVLVDDYECYVKPALEKAEQEYKEIRARVDAAQDVVDKKADREKRKALFKLVK